MTILDTTAAPAYDADSHTMPHQIFEGNTWHSRLLPRVNKFVYPYRYWGLNISALAAGNRPPEVSKSVFGRHRWSQKLPLFSTKKRALQQFCPDDYLSKSKNPSGNSTRDQDKVAITDRHLNPVQALQRRLHQAFAECTGSAPSADIIGLLVCRNAGIYFSPVNFYIGFDEHQTPTHLLAEVSNTPWDKRHYYGFLLAGAHTKFCHDKDFHVSPFNPIDQRYRWQVDIESRSDSALQVRIAIDISDERGEVLKTGIKMSGVPMTKASVRQSLRQNPLMNITSVSRIYWHAFRLYALKKVPYVQYDEKLADSQQNSDPQKKVR